MPQHRCEIRETLRDRPRAKLSRLLPCLHDHWHGSSALDLICVHDLRCGLGWAVGWDVTLGRTALSAMSISSSIASSRAFLASNASCCAAASAWLACLRSWRFAAAVSASALRRSASAARFRAAACFSRSVASDSSRWPICSSSFCTASEKWSEAESQRDRASTHDLSQRSQPAICARARRGGSALRPLWRAADLLQLLLISDPALHEGVDA
jgi:hypothetical protein